MRLRVISEIWVNYWVVSGSLYRLPSMVQPNNRTCSWQLENFDRVNAGFEKVNKKKSCGINRIDDSMNNSSGASQFLHIFSTRVQLLYYYLSLKREENKCPRGLLARHTRRSLKQHDAFAVPYVNLSTYLRLNGLFHFFSSAVETIKCKLDGININWIDKLDYVD